MTPRKKLPTGIIGGNQWSYRFKCKDCNGEFHVQGYKRGDGVDELEESTECQCCGSANTESMYPINVAKAVKS